MRCPAVLGALLVAALIPAAAQARPFLVVHGRGSGHGAGMSQWGAYGYALHGAGYRAILAHYYRGTSLGSVRGRTVRVLLQVAGRARFRGASRAGSRHLNPRRTYSVTPAGTGLALHGAGQHAVRVSAPLRVTGPRPLVLRGRALNGTSGGAYRGALELRSTGGGTVQTVDAVGIDAYVKGVVPSEMPASWAAAALRAQAVAARTYAVTDTVGGHGYDLFPDQRSQVYKGADVETAATDAAVARTAGQVVTYHGRPVITYFFASSGGRTANVEDSFPGAAPEPWLVSVSDPYEGAAGAPLHRWKLRFTRRQAQAKLGSLVKGPLRAIKVTRHGATPRVVRARVRGSRGTTTATGTQLRNDLGLYSTWAHFSVRHRHHRRHRAGRSG